MELRNIDLSMDRTSGEFRGCAFVRFGSDADAIRVMSELDGCVLSGCTIRVSFVAREIPQGMLLRRLGQGSGEL